MSMRRLLITVTFVLALATPAAAMTCNGSAALCSRPLNHVVLPATHNSMSAASLGFQIPNQPVGIPDQLKAGDPWLPDRHALRAPDGRRLGRHRRRRQGELAHPPRRPYLCHVVCQIGATPLVPVLRSMRRFLRKHPGNVLVLDVETTSCPGTSSRP